MNGVQKIIKYIALAFGFLLAVNIIGAIVFGVLMAGSIFTGISIYSQNDSVEINDEIISIIENADNINVNLGACKLNILTGEEFKVSASNVSKKFKTEVKNGTLTIEDKNKVSFLKENKQEVIIFIPENTVFKNVYINSGVSRTYIQTINGQRVELNLGVGDVEIDNIISTQETKIDGGVGRLQIKSGEIDNLELSSGVGSSNIKAKITGNSKIDNGVGKLVLGIDADENDYTIKTSTGIGAITINGNRCSNDSKYGDGENKIDINGGIGAVEILTY